jgi:hypothetical protein
MASKSALRAMVLCGMALLVLLGGCATQPGGDPIDPGDGLTATIQPAGGTYTLDSGRVVLTVPAGAVAAATVVTVAEVTPPLGATHGTALGQTVAYRLNPATTTFAQNVTLSLPYTATTIPTGGDAGDVGIYTPGTDRWVAAGTSTATSATTRVSVPISQCGVYGVLVRQDTGAATAPAYIPDPALVTGLRTALAKPTGNITIGELTALTGQLDLQNYTIDDLTGLEHCTTITDLVVWHNELTNLAPIAGLTQLTRLSTGKNGIVDLTPLSGLTNLSELLLAYNNATDISPLAGLPLQSLSLSLNPVTDFSPLADIPTLRSFLMAHNPELTTITFAPYITQVTDLWLHGNAIVDISPLATLTALDTLHLSNNLITDLQPLVDNTGLTTGDSVDLDGNPLDLTAGSAASVDIAALRARGVTVNLTAATAARSPESP